MHQLELTKSCFFIDVAMLKKYSYCYFDEVKVANLDRISKVVQLAPMIVNFDQTGTKWFQ